MLIIVVKFLMKMSKFQESINNIFNSRAFSCKRKCLEVELISKQERIENDKILLGRNASLSHSKIVPSLSGHNFPKPEVYETSLKSEIPSSKALKDSHSIPYAFYSNPNALSNKGKTKITNCWQNSEEKKNKENAKHHLDIVTEAKNKAERAKKITLAPNKIKARAEKIYREHLFQTFQALKFVRELPSIDIYQLRKKRITLLKRLGFEEKKTIIFDLDETLVHCNYDLNKPSEVILKIIFPSDEIVSTGINVRPFARECLEEASKDFEVIVFTASQQCYADAVLDYLDPERRLIHHRLYRDNCLIVGGVFIKDLRIFSNRRLQDLVIVDNTAYSFGYHLDNGIPIISWYGDPYDRELFKLMDYVKILADVQDVRELNKQAFHMKTFYEDYIEEFLVADTKRIISPRANA